MKKLIEYLTENQEVLNFSAIEKMAKIPNRTLYQVVNNKREFPLHHLSNLLEVLIKIGGGKFTLGQFTFMIVSEHQEFEAYSIIEILEPIEVNDDKGNTIYFKYPATLSRDIITDEIDILTYLN